MTNTDIRIRVSDPYGSVKAAMSRGITHYYEDFYNARKEQLMKNMERKTNGTR